MKALVLNDINEKFKLTEVEKPSLLANEVLVNIKAAALNRRDYWIKIGKYAGLKFPIILGSDGAGVVTDVFDKENKHWIGKEICINPSLFWGENENYQGPKFNILGLPLDGTFAEYVKINVNQIVEKPKHLTFEETAALPLAGLTVYRALFSKAKLQKGENVLIVGAGAGTSTFAISFAVAAGANVFVTSRSQDKIDKAVKLGAKGGVVTANEGWEQCLKEISGGFDVIMDSVLGDDFNKHFTYVNNGGRIVFFGATAGALPALPAREIFWKQIQILGTTMGSPKDFKEMMNFVEHYNIKPIINEVYDIKNADEAFDLIGKGEQFGKIVLKIS